MVRRGDGLAARDEPTPAEAAEIAANLAAVRADHLDTIREYGPPHADQERPPRHRSRLYFIPGLPIRYAGRRIGGEAS